MTQNQSEGKNGGKDAGALKQKVNKIPEFKVNHCFLIMYCVTLTSNAVSNCYATGGYNQVAGLFASKLEWTAEETRFYNSLITVST